MVIHDAFQFLREVKIELSKVIWPKFDDWTGSSIVVLVLVTIFALYLWAIDVGFARLAEYIFKLYRSY